MDSRSPCAGQPLTLPTKSMRLICQSPPSALKIHRVAIVQLLCLVLQPRPLTLVWYTACRCPPGRCTVQPYRLGLDAQDCYSTAGVGDQKASGT